MTTPQWRVRAWVIAPGDFPSRDLKAVDVHADTIQAAIRKAERSLAFQDDATVVSAERISPPAGKERLMKRIIRAVTLACVTVLAVAACGGQHKQAVTTTPGPVHVTRCTPQDQTMDCVLSTLPAPPSLRPRLAPGQLFGVDFGWSGINAAHARQLGARFGASYLSFDSSKNWTRALIDSYHAAGLPTVAVWETSALRATAGRAAGVSDARTARAQAAALGNTTRPILFAVDCDCTGASILAYFQGVHSVLDSRADAYGGYSQVAFLHGQHLVGNQNWQTYAWSSVNGVTRWLPASIAPLEQYLNGSSFDNDRAIAADYGQFPYDPAPVDIGGAQHYERYPMNAPARPDRERPTVQGWDSNHCLNPVRRHVCKVTRAHLTFDLGRDQALYAHDSKTLRDALFLPGRIQGLVHRLDGRGVVHAWL